MKISNYHKNNHHAANVNTIWSRYRATHRDIYPVSSRLFYFGYMFTAVPFAFVSSVLLYAAGRTLKRYMRSRL
jgi:hypothetical protein